MQVALPHVVNYRGLAAGVIAGIERASDFYLDRGHVAACLRRVPSRMHSAIVRAYARTHQEEGNSAANLGIAATREAFADGRLDVASSDDEIRQAAENRAATIQAMLALRSGMADVDAVRSDLVKYCERQGVKAPNVGTLGGLVGRMSDAGWWRRAFRRSIVRQCERACISIGMVHRHASIYASEEAVHRRAQQRRRNGRMLDATEAVNENGEAFTLAELSARNVSNPTIRRAELMTRIRGFEEWAEGQGHVGVFYTWTLPSRFHARRSASGDRNPKHDGSTPKDGAGFLGRQWAKCRAALGRRGLGPYGFRIAEPHHDGTPHWHLLLFMAAEEERACSELMQRYAWQPDADELSADRARDARFKAIRIDPGKGSAAGYIAKYVAKNIDGAHVGTDDEAGIDSAFTVGNVDAWASTWGIRQFQQIGGPGVTVWRELRRMREAPLQGELFGDAWAAADAGDWRAYTAAQTVRRVSLWKEPGARLNRYGEPAADQCKGVQCGGAQWVTRTHTWVLRPRKAGAVRSIGRGGDLTGHRAGDAPARGAIALPWTRVNNCTPWVGVPGMVSRIPEGPQWLTGRDLDEWKRRHGGEDGSSTQCVGAAVRAAGKGQGGAAGASICQGRGGG